MPFSVKWVYWQILPPISLVRHMRVKDGGTTLENVEWVSSIRPQACAFKFWGEKKTHFCVSQKKKARVWSRVPSQTFWMQV